MGEAGDRAALCDSEAVRQRGEIWGESMLRVLE